MSKHFLITGVSIGLGAALVSEALERGFYVTGTSRRHPSEIPSFNFWKNTGRFKLIQCDLSIDSIQNCIKTQLNYEQPLDFVILNASFTTESDIHGNNTFLFEKAKKVFELNVLSNLLLIKECTPFLKRGGAFIFMSSFSAIRAIVSKKIAYAASKAAMNKCFEGFRIQRVGDGCSFKVFQLGLLVEKQSRFLSPSYYFCDTYENTAKYILNNVNKKKDVYNYPFFLFILYQLSKFIPDSIIMFIVERARRYLLIFNRKK